LSEQPVTAASHGAVLHLNRVSWQLVGPFRNCTVVSCQAEVESFDGGSVPVLAAPHRRA